MSALPAELANLGGGPVTIAGKYRVERVLGEGGMGVILEATHLQLEERVAIKVLRANLAKDDQLVARFLREARTAIKIRSEHVVRILDVASLDSGAPYIVMELLEGTDLDKVLSDRGPLRSTNAVDYVLQICEALAEAHARGMVHRDLKPANLFLTRRSDGSECVKVLDFGITKLAETELLDPGTTGTKEIFGSPTYMSPEQMRSSRKVDARADIWALGIILYELVALSTPFNDGSMPELCAAVLHEEPHPLPAHVPAELAAIIMKCLRKPVDERFRDVGELAAALVPFATDAAEATRSSTRAQAILRAQARPSVSGGEPPPVSSPRLDLRPSAPNVSANVEANPGVTAGAWGRDARAPRTHRTIIAIGAALVGAAVIFLAGYRLARPPAPAAAGGPSVVVAPPVSPPTPPSAAAAPAPLASTQAAPAEPAPTATATVTATVKASASVPGTRKAPASAPKTGTTTPPTTRPVPPTPTEAPAKPPAELFDQRK